MVRVRKKSVEFVEKLINQKRVDLESSWSFEADDENEIIEKLGFETFQNVHLAYDDEGNPEAKGTYKFPVAKLKGGEIYVFRRGVIATKQRAAQQGYDTVFEVASKLLEKIDEVFVEPDEVYASADMAIIPKDFKRLQEPDEVYASADQKIKRSREFQIDAKDEDILELSVSSENPIRRFGYWEVLVHTKDAIVSDYLDAGIQVLFNHNPNEVVGVGEQWELRNGKLYVRVRISSMAEPFRTMIREKVLRHASITYEVLDMEQTSETLEGMPVVKVTRWRPLEVSFVSIPADISVGVGRAMEIYEEDMKKATDMKESGNIEVNIEVIEKGVKEMEKILPTSQINVEVETRQYSLTRVLQALVDNRTLDGYEGEIHAEIERQVGKRAQGVYVPFSVFSRASDLSGIATKVHTGIVGEYPVVGSLEKAGATVLKGLQGQATVGIYGEYPDITWGSTGSASDIKIKGYDLLPNTGFVFFGLYRNMLKQSTPDTEKYIRNYVEKTITRGIEKAALTGSGHANGQPLGLVNFDLGTGFAVHAAEYDNLTYDAIVTELLSRVAGKSPKDHLVFLMDPEMYATLKTLPKVSGYPIYVIGENDTIDGYPVLVHAGMPAKTIAFGDISTLLLAYWGAVDIIFNQYQGPAIRFDCYVEFDSAVIVPSAWSVLVIS